MENEKKKISKKAMIVGAVICVLVILAVVLVLVWFEKNKPETTLDEPNGNEPVLEEPDRTSALARDTEDLLNSYHELATTEVSLEKIAFSSAVNLEVGSFLEVYVYSSPKFVGTFEVREENGVKYISGMKEVIDSLSLESGEHHLALVLNDEVLGYVTITLSALNSEEEKPEEVFFGSENTREETIVETEMINFNTKEVNNTNMKRGTRKATTVGVNGSKEVTYKVTYDSNNKEIKREKVAEKVLKDAVDEVVAVGVSDYNVNTSTYIEYAGPMCKTVSSNGVTCEENDKNFKAISVDGKPIIVCIADVCQVNEVNVHLSASWSSGASLVATYEGQTRYFFTNKATDTQKLTMEDCTKYGLACGSW